MQLWTDMADIYKRNAECAHQRRQKLSKSKKAEDIRLLNVMTSIYIEATACAKMCEQIVEREKENDKG